MILIVSHPADEHAAGVLSVLQDRQHPVILFDTARYPSEVQLSHVLEGDDQIVTLTQNGRSLGLQDCHAAWWRRCRPFGMDPCMAGEAASFAYSECYEALTGLWLALDVRWVNPPSLDERAHHKPFQLRTASRVGLTIPRTVITNDPAAARSFARARGTEGTIYKTFLATESFWRETRLLRPEEIPLLDQVRLAPVIFQEYVRAEADLRITAVGERLFVTEIRQQKGAYRVDYRMDMDAAEFTAAELPVDTTAALHRLMKELGLVYGAIDMRRTADGAYIFLEVNPAGEWRFVEDRTGQPITAAMAELLIALDAQRDDLRGDQHGTRGDPPSAKRRARGPV